MQTLTDRICAFIRQIDASLPETCPKELWTQARTNLQALADHLRQDGPPTANPDTVLSAFLEANRDCMDVKQTAEQALATLHKAGFPIPKRGNGGLDRHPLWKGFKERQAVACMDSNPEASVTEHCRILGMSRAAFYATEAYQERREGRRRAKAVKRYQKDCELRDTRERRKAEREAKKQKWAVRNECERDAHVFATRFLNSKRKVSADALREELLKIAKGGHNDHLAEYVSAQKEDWFFNYVVKDRARKLARKLLRDNMRLKPSELSSALLRQCHDDGELALVSFIGTLKDEVFKEAIKAAREEYFE